MTFRLHFNSSRLKVLKFHFEPVIFNLSHVWTLHIRHTARIQCEMWTRAARQKLLTSWPLLGYQLEELELLPPATKLRQGNIFTPVCQSFRWRGGVCYTPWAEAPGQTPPPRPDAHPPACTCWNTPPRHNACWDTVNKRAVRFLLECIIVFLFYFNFNIMYLLLREHQ